MEWRALALSNSSTKLIGAAGAGGGGLQLQLQLQCPWGSRLRPNSLHSQSSSSSSSTSCSSSWRPPATGPAARRHRRLLPLRTQPNPNANPHENKHLGDLAPVPPSARSFSALDLATLWIGLVVGVPSYYLAGSLVDLGMSWLQGVSTVFLANALLLIPLLLTAYPATALGIPFPVLARASFGTRGSHLPSLLRALVACGWFGIESWIGGQALCLLLFNTSSNSFALQFRCFLLFWSLQLAIVLRLGLLHRRRLRPHALPPLPPPSAPLPARLLPLPHCQHQLLGHCRHQHP